MNLNKVISFLEKQEACLELPDSMKEWYLSHKINPKEISLEGKTYYLITDNNGTNDSSYRIIIDPKDMLFHLEATDVQGACHFLWMDSDSLSDVILNM